ncbi:MAG: acyloxyacyl hydrolase [Phycisphaerales bacterium JB038]
MGKPRHSVSFGLLPIVYVCLLAIPPSAADNLELQSLSLRARISEKTLLGDEAPEDFEEYDLSANVALPWEHYATSGWGMGTRLMASAGLLRGVGENALVVSVIPEVTLGSQDGRFLLDLDLGVGGALFGRHRFGTQDYGGPFQFALTLGIGGPLYGQLGIGYRFLHYSDAGVNGSDTTGADFHMIEFRYRY